ncbi:MAG: ribosomal-protein-alanine N-acetyltransferase [Ruminococcaceae bacterium]|nr:ribosomal-protein-alanine N-acetyltransferase [Oscillospiraceae bacterium]
MEHLKKEVSITLMTHDHLDEVAALERVCFSDPWSRNMLAEELDNAMSAYLVALDKEDGSVVGYAGLYVVADEGYITNVAVRPESRRGGVAGALLDVLINFAEGNALAFLTLEVRASNYAAIALYGSRGFRGVGRRTNYYEHPREDAIIMTKVFGDDTDDGNEAGDGGTAGGDL